MVLMVILYSWSGILGKLDVLSSRVGPKNNAFDKLHTYRNDTLYIRRRRRRRQFVDKTHTTDMFKVLPGGMKNYRFQSQNLSIHTKRFKVFIFFKPTFIVVQKVPLYFQNNATFLISIIFVKNAKDFFSQIALLWNFLFNFLKKNNFYVNEKVWKK